MESGDPAEPVKFFPQWMLLSGPSSTRERAESSWSRSRRGDISPSSLPPADINLKLNTDQNPAPTKETQRRPSDRYRGQRGYPERYSNRQGGAQFPEATGNGAYASNRHGGPLSRSFSEGHGRPAGHGRPKREDRELGGDSKETGKGGRRHHRSASTRDPVEKEGLGLDKEGRFGGLPDTTRRRDQKESGSNAKDAFEKNFPSLGDQLNSWEKPGNRASNQGSGNHGRWTSRLAEQPAVDSNGNISHTQQYNHVPLSPMVPPAQPARMADAVQQNPVDPEQNIMAEKQRLEMEQSRRLIPVIANPGKAKNGGKGQTGNGRRGEHRETLQKFASMVSAKKVDDLPKPDASTLVLPKKTSLTTQKLGDTTSCAPAMNGFAPLSPTNQEKQDIPPRGRRSRGESQDFSTHEKTKAQERGQNRLAFFNNLRRQSGTTSAGEALDSSTTVKRTVSESSVLDEDSIDKNCGEDLGLKMAEANNSVPGDLDIDLEGYHENGTTQKEMESTPVVEMCVHEPMHGEEITEEVDDSHLLLPSAEEERFLISLGWSANEEVTLLTEEEIAAWQQQRESHSISLRSPSNQRGTQPLSSYRCSAFHLNTFEQQTFLVGSEVTTSDSDSM